MMCLKWAYTDCMGLTGTVVLPIREECQRLGVIKDVAAFTDKTLWFIVIPLLQCIIGQKNRGNYDNLTTFSLLRGFTFYTEKRIGNGFEPFAGYLFTARHTDAVFSVFYSCQGSVDFIESIELPYL